MILHYDNNYGADIDGNRGISVLDYAEIEDSDYEYIRNELILNDDLYNYSYNDTIQVYFTEIDDNLDVVISDYMTQEEFISWTKDEV